jgi:hypothetical protein
MAGVAVVGYDPSWPELFAAERADLEQALVPWLSGGAPHRPRVLWFSKPPGTGGAQHTHHLHLTEPGSDLWRKLASGPRRPGQ